LSQSKFDTRNTNIEKIHRQENLIMNFIFEFPICDYGDRIKNPHSISRAEEREGNITPVPILTKLILVYRDQDSAISHRIERERESVSAGRIVRFRSTSAADARSRTSCARPLISTPRRPTSIAARRRRT
jgi:hypothetical protein